MGLGLWTEDEQPSRGSYWVRGKKTGDTYARYISTPGARHFPYFGKRSQDHHISIHLSIHPSLLDPSIHPSIHPLPRPHTWDNINHHHHYHYYPYIHPSYPFKQLSFNIQKLKSINYSGTAISNHHFREFLYLYRIPDIGVNIEATYPPGCLEYIHTYLLTIHTIHTSLQLWHDSGTTSPLPSPSASPFIYPSISSILRLINPFFWPCNSLPINKQPRPPRFRC